MSFSCWDGRFRCANPGEWHKQCFLTGKKFAIPGELNTNYQPTKKFNMKTITNNSGKEIFFFFVDRYNGQYKIDKMSVRMWNRLHDDQIYFKISLQKSKNII